MAYYKTCPECGAALDPGEICDCREKQRNEEHKKAALDAANIRGGRVEQASHKLNYSTPIVPNDGRRCQY